MLINKNPGNMPLVPQRTPHEAKSAAAAVGRRDAYQNQSQGDEQQLGGDDEDFGASMHMTALNRHSSLEKEKGPAVAEEPKQRGKRGSLVITSLTRNLSAEKGERNHNSSLNSHASQSSWQTSKNLRGVGGGGGGVGGGGGAGRASGNFVEKVVRRCSGDLLSSGLAQNYPDSSAAVAAGGGGGGGGGAANLVQTMRRFGNRGSIGHDEKKDDASAAANAKGGQVGDKECEATRQLNELNDMMAELRRENRGAYIGAAQLRHMAVQRIHQNKERRRMSAERDGSGKPRRSKSVDALERLRNLAGGGEDGGGDPPQAAGRRASNEEKDANLRGSRGRARGRARGRRGSSNFCCDGEDTRRRSTSADALKRLSMLVGGNDGQAAAQSGGGGMEWGARHDSKSDFDFASYAVSGAGAGGGEAVARRRRGHRGSLGRVSERGGGNESGGNKESPNRMPRARSADGLKQLAGLFGGEEKDKKLESPAPQKQHVIMRRGSDLVIQTPMFERGSLEDDDSSESGSEDEEEDKKGEATDGGKKMFPWQQEVAPATNDGGGRGERRGRGGGNSSKIKPSGSFESITRLAGMLSNGMAAERREEDFALLARRQQTNAARRGNMMASSKRSSMPMAEQPSEMNERQRKEAQWKASLGFGPPVVDQHPHPRPGGEAVELQERPPRRAEAAQEDVVEDEETKMRLLEVEREREEEMEYLYKLRPAARGGRANSGGALPVNARPAPRGGRTRSGGALSGGGLPSQSDTNTAPIQGSAELDYEQQLLLATHRAGGGAPLGGGGGRVGGGGVLKGSSEPIAVHPSELAHRPNQRRPGGLKSALKGSSEPVAIAPSELFAQRRYEGGLEAENRRASDGFGQRGSMVGEPEHRRASDGCVPENRRGSAGWATGGDAGRQLPYGVNVPKGYSEPSEPIPVHRPFERANRSAVQDPLRPQAVQAPMKTEDGSGGKEEKGGWRNLVRRLSGDAKNSTVVRGMEEDGGARDATTAGGAPPEAQELRRRESLQKMSSVRRNRLSDGGRFLDLTQDRRYSEHALGCDSEDENSDPRRPSVTKDGGVYEIDTATGDGHGGKMKKTYSEEELKSVDTSVAGEDYYGYPGMIPDDDSGAEEDRFGVSRWNESGLMSEIDRRRYSRRRSSIHSSGAASDGAAEEPTPWETLAKDFEDDGLGDGHPSGNGAAEDRLNASSKWHESGLMSEADRRQYRRRRSSVHSSGALSDGAGDEPSPWENLGGDEDGGADKPGSGDNNGSSGAFEAFDLDEY